MKPATVIAPLALVVALSGTAVAAGRTSGGAIRLGHRNSASRPTAFADKRDTALALVAKHGKPPIGVHGDTTEVPSLNASLLGGLTAGSLQPQDLVITAFGKTTFTVPKGFTQMFVLLIGGGGGGGQGDPNDEVGSGGGAGGHLVVWVPVTPGSRWQVSVGEGSAGASAGHPATAGGDTRLYSGLSGPVPLAAAHGGKGGADGTSCSSGTTENLAGGAGGTEAVAPGASRAVGVTSSDGEPGGVGSWTCDTGGNAGAGGGIGSVGAGGAGGGDGAGGVQIDGYSGRPGGAVVEFLR